MPVSKQILEGTPYGESRTNPTPQERWKNGIPHDPRSEEIYGILAEADIRFGDGYFEWSSGGDGDNGEVLMFMLDSYFFDKDQDL